MSALLLLAALAADDPYHWPLELPRIVTSSFSEFRGGRFHAGIDLRIGSVGPAVRAAADGHVSRVRCSPWGYGKAVYLTLDDGNMAVYAHLDGFAPAIEAYVRRAQHAARSYTVDLTPDPAELRVRRGEIVAYAGKTGTAVPHLHYELRDPANRPVNPRLLGLTWPDSTPPTLRKLLIVPQGPDSTVDGDIAPVVHELRRGADGRYTCPPVRARGRIGFAVDVIDPANEGANILGVRVLRAQTGGAELFRVQHDRLSYDTMHNGAVAWHPHFTDHGRFWVLWRWPGNVAESYAATPSDGWFSMPDGEARFEIEAVDFHDNRALLDIALRPDDTAIPSPAARESANPGHVVVETIGEWLLITVRFPDAEPVMPTLYLEGPPPAQGGALMRVGRRTFRAGYLPGDTDGTLVIRVEHERLAPFTASYEVFRRGGARAVESAGLRLKSAADSPYGTMFLRVEPLDTPPPAPIPLRGGAWRVEPASTPIDAPLEIALSLPRDVRDPAKAHIYRASGSSWSRESSKQDGAFLTARTRGLGAFAVLEDDRPPQIRDVAPADGATLTTPRPAIRAAVSDVGSGIAEYEVTANGQWLLAEYDPYAGTIAWMADHDLGPGPVELVFIVTDAAGNTATARRSARIEPAPATP